ncbi:hypothetical protein M5689_000717 [Euphorbia peplus]|nr:hypothetical protein M5689_000717 [Euphorbia peplus]
MFKYLKRKLDKSEADKFLRFTQVYSDIKVLEEKLCKQFSTPAKGLKAKGKEKLPLGSDKPQKKKKPVTPSLLKEISSPPDAGTSESAAIASEESTPSKKKKKALKKQRERSKNPPFYKLCKSDGQWLKDCKYHIKNILQSEISLKPPEDKSNSEGPNKDWVPVTN